MSHRGASLEYHLAIAVSAVLFRVRPLLRLSQARRSQSGGLVFVWATSNPVTSRSFHEKAVEHLWDWSGRIACTNWLRAMVPLYHECNYPDPFGFFPVCARLTIGLYYR